MSKHTAAWGLVLICLLSLLLAEYESSRADHWYVEAKEQQRQAQFFQRQYHQQVEACVDQIHRLEGIK